jgi:ferritin-like metal-binding protein YciE
MVLNTLRDLFVFHLQEMYNAESQIADALPLLAQTAHSQSLHTLLEEQLEATTRQIERLQDIFEHLSIAHDGQRSEAMRGLVRQAEAVAGMEGDSLVRDAALVSAVQCIEHYGIASYGALRTYAGDLGLDEPKRALQAILDEQAGADRRLTRIAQGGLFRKGVNQLSPR